MTTDVSLITLTPAGSSLLMEFICACPTPTLLPRMVKLNALFRTTKNVVRSLLFQASSLIGLKLSPRQPIFSTSCPPRRSSSARWSLPFMAPCRHMTIFTSSGASVIPTFPAQLAINSLHVPLIVFFLATLLTIKNTATLTTFPTASSFHLTLLSIRQCFLSLSSTHHMTRQILISWMILLTMCRPP